MSNQKMSATIDSVVDKVKSALHMSTDDKHFDSPHTDGNPIAASSTKTANTNNNNSTTQTNGSTQATTATNSATKADSTTASDASKKPFSRLPTYVVPKHYDLTLIPNLTAFTFTGEVCIDVDVRESTKTVLMNAKELKVQGVQILNKLNKTQLSTATFELTEATDLLTITSAQSLAVGTPYTIVIQYTGILNDKLHGFYRSKYTDSNGQEKYMACTQFESTDARQALPCWDEPACKATFTVHISAAKHLTVVSNMNETEAVSDKVTSGNVVHSFAPTPIMSTYLLAFVVGEFDYVEDKTKNGTDLRVYTAVGKKEQGRFALDAGKRALEFYNDYFGIPYPLPKMDQLAIPDFSAGAMENWGCITYRETLLLNDENNSSMQTKQTIALVVAHEIAHQWFGNIVTMEWWTHLWLNEGYATWMQYFCTDHMFPEWNVWGSYVFRDYSTAMEVDALASSHPIEVNVGHPDEVQQIFDHISYAKGSAVIRMLQNYLGEKHFQDGLSAYLKKHAYGNALTEDLWHQLAETSLKPVSEVMTAWTKQTGYPLITVSEPVSDGMTVTIECTQSRFLANGTDGGKDTWPVPITFALPNNVHSSGSQLLHDKTAKLSVASGLKEIPLWIKLNRDQTSLFRTLYPPSMYAALCDAIVSQDPSLSASDRLGIQNDAFALSRAGKLSGVRVLELVAAYSKETDDTVWADLTKNINDLSTIIYASDDAQTYTLFCQFVCALYAPILRKLGWKKHAGESSQDTLLRSTVIKQAGKYGHEETIRTAQTMFTQHYNAINSNSTESSHMIPADLRGAVYGMAVAYGGKEAYSQTMTIYQKAELNEEKVRALQALGATQSPEQLAECLRFAMSDDVRKQDAPWVVQAAAQPNTNLPIVWEYTKLNWKTIYDIFGAGYVMGHWISLFDRFATKQRYAEVQKFYASGVPTSGVERAVAQTLEKIEANEQWVLRDGHAIKEWLVHNQQMYAGVKVINAPRV